MSEEDIKNGKGTAASSQDGDTENLVEKVKYPRAIPFIISNEFCERFNYYGMRTILVLYLTRKLLFDDDTATILYHSFTTLVYFCCIIGAIIADSWWGKFHTILWLSMLYVAGSSVIAIGAIESWNLPATVLTFIGLGLVAFGSGGIKPCVAAFGGEQFKLPQQARQLAVFFSLFYFSINAGSLISTSVTPILRELKCFGSNDCFFYGFGLPAVLMAISVVVFLVGRFLYKIVPPQGNMFMKVCRCIGTAISTRSREKNTNPKEHWLDYAETTHGRKLVKETRILLNVLVLYLPLPFFWALFDQQGSRWTFQATRMDGDLGFYTIRPDQMQVINPFLILVFIPLYEIAFYPVLNLLGIRRPLQKIALGGIFAGVAFLASMIVELALEKTYPVLPVSGEAQLRIFNGLNCDYTVNVNLPNSVGNINLEANSHFFEINVPVKGEVSDFPYTMTTNTAGCNSIIGNFTLSEKQATSYFIKGTGSAPISEEFEDDPEKSRQGTPLIRVLANLQTNAEIMLKDKDGSQYAEDMYNRNLTDVPANKYEIYVGGNSVKKDVELRLGGVYTILIQEKTAGKYEAEVITVTEANSVNMLWVVPQYVIMTLGEVMFSVTGLQFSYTQAPESMRSVLQGCWQLTVAVGNLIVTIIVGASFFSRQTFEFALFAGLMFVDMGIFMWLAIRYKPIPLETLKDAEDEQEEKKKDPLDFPGTSTNGQDN